MDEIPVLDEPVARKNKKKNGRQHLFSRQFFAKPN